MKESDNFDRKDAYQWNIMSNNHWQKQQLYTSKDQAP